MRHLQALHFLILLLVGCFYQRVQPFKNQFLLSNIRSRSHTSLQHPCKQQTILHAQSSTSSSNIPISQYSKFGKQLTDLTLEAPSLNSRRITASIIIDSSVENVWSVLSDYNNLATHIPNLVKSNLLPSPPGTIKLFQEGAQKIIGFDFRASLVMDMTEERDLQNYTDDSYSQWKIGFKLSESRMFDAFDGSWVLRCHSRSKEIDPITNEIIYHYKTKLTYTVLVRPRGPVPVLALEWRVREDIPINLFAVKVAAEKKNIERSKNLIKTLPNNNPSTGTGQITV